MDIKQQLRQHGYKLTKQRKQIIDILQANDERLMSVDALFLALGEQIDLSTIYRNLEVLDDCHLIHKVQSGDKALYKLICQPEHHHHLICLECGATQVLDYCPAPEIEALAQQHDFEVRAHMLEVFGLCQACRQLKPEADEG